MMALVELRIEAVAQRLAEAIQAEAPELLVTVDGDDVIVEGAGLATDPRLRWIGGLLR